MPVKVTKPTATKPAPEANKQQALDQSQLKLIQKLATPLAKSAKGMKLAEEALDQTTFKLYADFRSTAREHFEDNPKAVRALAVAVLASVYDVPMSAIHITGTDQDVLVYPETYIDKKGKKRNHPNAGEPLDDDAGDDDKEIAVHPKVQGAARLYNLCTRLLKVAIPADERALELVDEALDDDGKCQCTEAQLYALANGTSREIVPKGSHGGHRPAKVYDDKLVTSEIGKTLRRAWNGNEVVPGLKGTMDLAELTECTVAAINELQVEVDKIEKAQKKAQKKGAAKAEPEETEEE